MSPTPFRAASAAALLLLAGAALGQTVDGKPQIKAQVLDRVTALLENQAYVPGLDFAKWKEFSEAMKSKVDSSKDDDEFDLAVNEAFSKFGASHISLITPRYTSLRNTGNMVGIGISPQKTDEGTLILRTVPNAAADKAGLVPGDTIVKVDGKPADGAKGIAGGGGHHRRPCGEARERQGGGLHPHPGQVQHQPSRGAHPRGQGYRPARGLHLRPQLRPPPTSRR